MSSGLVGTSVAGPRSRSTRSPNQSRTLRPCRAGPRDYLAAHPSCPPLVLEVAETTLAFDRDHKSSLYARAQIPDYWLINLPDHVVQVHRDPAPDADAPYGWRYTTILLLRADEFVTPLARSSVPIAVADLLP